MNRASNKSLEPALFAVGILSEVGENGSKAGGAGIWLGLREATKLTASWTDIADAQCDRTK